VPVRESTGFNIQSKAIKTPHLFSLKGKKMVQENHKIRTNTGSTLLNTLIAVAIILIALIGTSNFRYYSTLDARKASAQTTAARIALMLCESWGGIQGSTSYNPVAHLGSDIIVVQTEGPDKPDDFTFLGSYRIVLDEQDDGANGADYFATLSWKDIKPGLRALNVIIAWAQRGQKGLENTNKTFTLTIYTLT
jgi:hypothetical protein